MKVGLKLFHPNDRRNILNSSPSQLYRLLGPANYQKSVDEMLHLIAALGYRVEVRITKEAA